MWIRAIWSLETKLVFKNLSNNDDIIAFPHTADISQAFFASTCLAGLLDSTVDHSVWTTWVINSLKSSRYLEIMVVLTVISQAKTWQSSAGRFRISFFEDLMGETCVSSPTLDGRIENNI
ncbi:unnamed protein product [Aphanomyces euteiches]